MTLVTASGFLAEIRMRDVSITKQCANNSNHDVGLNVLNLKTR
jgi:hypothetical protein